MISFYFQKVTITKRSTRISRGYLKRSVAQEYFDLLKIPTFRYVAIPKGTPNLDLTLGRSKRTLCLQIDAVRRGPLIYADRVWLGSYY